MIKLSQIIDSLYDVNIESSCYYDKKNNKILWHLGDNEEYSTYQEDDEFNEDIIFMFNFYTKNDYDIMQDFIKTIDNDGLRNELLNETRGKNAFQRFRKVIDYNNITNDWYVFRDNEYKKIAEEWCKEHKIDYENDC